MSLKSILSNVLLIFVPVYFILGNLPRIISLPGFRDNLLVTEVILYLLVGSIILINIKRYLKYIRDYNEFSILILIIFVSSLIGFIYHEGQYIKALIYCIRLISILVSSLVFSITLYDKYKLTFDLEKILHKFLWVFFIYTILGWLMLFIFPDSFILWEKLKSFGITFVGDPHVNRFMGTMFDPNFSSSILIIPAIICIYLYFNCEKDSKLINIIYLLAFAYFSICIVLTVSRSGLVGLIITILIILLNFVFRLIKREEKMERKHYQFVFISIVSLTIAAVIFLDTIIRLLSRFIGIFSDPSAQHRFNDFYIGIKHVFSSWYTLFFGIGYNYIPFDLKTDLGALDSSLVNILLCFGLLGSIPLVICAIKILINSLNGYKRVSNNFHIYLIGYFGTCLLICNFNNLLFYQFYIMSAIILLNLGYVININEKV